jgi:predicted transcriptional regulator
LAQEVVDALSEAGRPLTPGEVQERLGDELAYTTVMTVLARLYDKGLVTRERAGRAYAYRSIEDAAEVTARQMRRLLEAGDDRAAVLAHFVGVLCAEDEAVLVDLVRRADSATLDSGGADAADGGDRR